MSVPISSRFELPQSDFGRKGAVQGGTGAVCLSFSPSEEEEKQSAQPLVSWVRDCVRFSVAIMRCTPFALPSSRGWEGLDGCPEIERWGFWRCAACV